MWLLPSPVQGKIDTPRKTITIKTKPILLRRCTTVKRSKPCKCRLMTLFGMIFEQGMNLVGQLAVMRVVIVLADDQGKTQKIFLGKSWNNWL